MNEFRAGLASVFSQLPECVWGAPLVLLLLAAGIWFTVRCGFFQFRIPTIIKNTLGRRGKTPKNSHSISPFEALSTALSATIGTGNIAGVAASIVTGGAGVLFWMWVAAIFGMITKYTEIVLGVTYRVKNTAGGWMGGPMYYIERGLGEKKGLRLPGRFLAVMFAVLTVFASFGIGNLAQTDTITTSLRERFPLPPVLIGLSVAAVAMPVILGGVRRVAGVASKLVPLMGLLYVAATLWVIFVNREQIPEAIRLIVRSAFGLDTAAGVFSWALFRQTAALGIRRGVFTHEAGLGSSAIGHSAAAVEEPAEQGLWGILEVFIDTIVLCTLTGFAILTSGVLGQTGPDGQPVTGVALVARALSTALPQAAVTVLTICIFLFAFSSLLGWSVYGAGAATYLFGERAARVYRICFCVMIAAGVFVRNDLVWNISDTLNGLMAFPNLIALFFLSGVVVRRTRVYRARLRRL